MMSAPAHWTTEALEELEEAQIAESKRIMCSLTLAELDSVKVLRRHADSAVAELRRRIQQAQVTMTKIRHGLLNMTAKESDLLCGSYTVLTGEKPTLDAAKHLTKVLGAILARNITRARKKRPFCLARSRKCIG